MMVVVVVVVVVGDGRGERDGVEGEAWVTGTVTSEDGLRGGGGRGGITMVVAILAVLCVAEEKVVVDVNDGELKRGTATSSQLVLDVLVEEVQEHGGGDAEREAQEVPPGARWRAVVGC